uniref:EAL domain-containing protein n=1 Tax=Acinetobacter venetianus TaxID=52133 RepID=UPI0032B2F86F
KIDRGFLTDLQPNSKEEAIFDTIIHLAAKLGLVVTAEGVETQQQADILTSLGCNQLQGYLLGIPVNVESLVLNQHHHFA